MTKRITEEFGIVYALKPGDHQAGVDGDSINTKNYREVAFLIQAATLTGDAVLKVYSGATDGTKTTAETFRYRLADADQAAAGADQFDDEATSAALTLTAATYSDRVLVVEISADELTADQPFVTLEIGAEASAFNAAVVAVLRGARYQASDMPTAIPTS